MYGFTQDLPISPDMWFRIKEAIGDTPAEGLILHAVIRHGDGVRYFDLWESGSCDRFLEERVHPVLRKVFAAAGAELPGEPDRVEFETTLQRRIDHRSGRAGRGVVETATREPVASRELAKVPAVADLDDAGAEHSPGVPIGCDGCVLGYPDEADRGRQPAGREIAQPADPPPRHRVPVDSE
jgi:hypothetical protein